MSEAMRIFLWGGIAGLAAGATATHSLLRAFPEFVHWVDALRKKRLPIQKSKHDTVAIPDTPASPVEHAPTSELPRNGNTRRRIGILKAAAHDSPALQPQITLLILRYILRHPNLLPAEKLSQIQALQLPPDQSFLDWFHNLAPCNDSLSDREDFLREIQSLAAEEEWLANPAWRSVLKRIARRLDLDPETLLRKTTRVR